MHCQRRGQTFRQPCNYVLARFTIQCSRNAHCCKKDLACLQSCLKFWQHAEAIYIYIILYIYIPKCNVLEPSTSTEYKLEDRPTAIEYSLMMASVLPLSTSWWWRVCYHWVLPDDAECTTFDILQFNTHTTCLTSHTLKRDICNQYKGFDITTPK